MTTQTVHVLSLLLFLGAVAQSSPIERAAAKYVPGIKWQVKSVVTADLSCRGQKDQAILGTSESEIIIAVFLNGTSERPEILRYSANARRAALAKLSIENQDYEPKTEIGSDLPGFRRSKTCKGMNLSDGEVDSAHIYWNHEAHRFDDWVR
jgi:hypothetical protein